MARRVPRRLAACGRGERHGDSLLAHYGIQRLQTTGDRVPIPSDTTAYATTQTLPNGEKPAPLARPGNADADAALDTIAMTSSGQQLWENPGTAATTAGPPLGGHTLIADDSSRFPSSVGAATQWSQVTNLS